MRIFPSLGKLFDIAEDSKPSSLFFPTGIKRFDEAMDGGLRDGELVIVSGPTGMGKTTFMQNLTMNYHNVEVPSIWFSHEMDPWYLKEKFVKIGSDETLLTYIPNDGIDSTIDYMERKIVEGNEDYLTKIVFIDHLHYLIPMSSAQNSSLMIGGVVRELKKLAIRTKSIIILAAHTKKIYADEEISLNSIRDSALIANEADFVFLVERLKNEKIRGNKPLTSKLNKEIPEWTNTSKVQLAKNRRTGILCYKLFEVSDNKFIDEDEKTKTIEKLKDTRRQNGLFGISKRISKTRRKLFDDDSEREHRKKKVSVSSSRFLDRDKRKSRKKRMD